MGTHWGWDFVGVCRRAKDGHDKSIQRTWKKQQAILCKVLLTRDMDLYFQVQVQPAERRRAALKSLL